MPGTGRRRTAGAPAGAAVFLTLACLTCLLLAPAAATAAPPAEVEVGVVRLAAPVDGRGALLVPVRYPIQLGGRPLELRLILRRPGRGGAIRGRRLRTRASAGLPRLPEQRRSFGFVHRIGLDARLTSLLRLGVGTGRHDGRARPVVQVDASGAFDLDRDGVPELDSADRELQSLPRGYAGSGLCASVPQLRNRPGKRTAATLPTCGAPVRWRIARPAEHGRARISGGKLVYRAARRFRGTDSVLLRPRRAGARASAATVAAAIQIKVGGDTSLVVRALGDSVTAGFGYYDDGTQMDFTSLLTCKPGATAYDDACSSNSTNRSNEEPAVAYAPDFGLANNVSWAAQWANAHAVTNYKNFAISGSEPADWAPGGQFYPTTARIEAEEPDYVLMTVGANPLLSEMLFGADNMGCAIWSDVFGRYRECIEAAFAEVHLRDNLKSLYADLVDNTEATIVLMQYPLSVPASALAYSATQIATMGAMLNEQIASVAAEVSSSRLRVAAPPHFNVGIDLAPIYPSAYSCSDLGYEVDGRSVQSEPSQDELLLDHPLSFCSGPASGPPWVIAGDTGIHPSAAGYAQMAAQVPPPR